MQALVYVANEQMAFREEADAEVLGSGEALVEIEAVGICGSDMHAYLGHDPRRVPPLILGHEAAGKVLDGELSGKRVVINPLITCGPRALYMSVFVCDSPFVLDAALWSWGVG